MSVEQVVDGIRNLIKKNLIATANVTSDLLTGDVILNIDNSFKYNDGEEFIVIDNNYNVEGATHYRQYEYLQIKQVNNTRSLTLVTPSIDNWYVSNGARIQKTIAHAPLFDEYVFYGDREVIPTEEMSITVEPVTVTNEWIALQGYLSQEFRMSIMVYGKSVATDEGMRTLNKYADSIYYLTINNIHIPLDEYDTPIVANVVSGSISVLIANTADNVKNIVPSTPSSIYPNIPFRYYVQDNNNVSIPYAISSVIPSGDVLVVNLYSDPMQHSYFTTEYAVLRRANRWIYDSRVDSVEYGSIQKGSALVRAARLSWFGKETEIFAFPQASKGVPDFKEIDPEDYMMSSSSSSSSS